jgi:hypothetical protein
LRVAQLRKENAFGKKGVKSHHKSSRQMNKILTTKRTKNTKGFDISLIQRDSYISIRFFVVFMVKKLIDLLGYYVPLAKGKFLIALRQFSEQIVFILPCTQSTRAQRC